MSLIDLASMVLAPTAVKDGKVYNAIPNDQDFTFSRGTEATRVNSAGLIEKARTNLLLQSNTFDTTWTTSNASVTGGQSGYDGSSDAWLLESTSTAFSLYQNYTQSGVSTFSIFAKKGTSASFGIDIFTSVSTNAQFFNLSNGTLDYSTGSVVSADIIDKGNGWYHCIVTTNNTGTIYYARITNGVGNTYIQSAQLEQGLVSTDVITTTTTSVTVGITDDLPRVDYSGGGCPSLLLEPSRTNKLPQSEYFQDSGYGSDDITFEGGYLAPDGTNSAYKITATTKSSAYLVYSTIFDANDARSIYAKTASGTGTTQLLSHNSNTNNTFTLTEEWQRFEVTSSPNISQNFYAVDFRGSSTTLTEVIIWGGQAEGSASYVSSYIPSYGTSTSRSADSCSKTGISSLLNDSEGTLFAEIKAQANESTTKVITIGDGTSSNRVQIFYQAGTNITTNIIAGGSSQVTGFTTAVDQTQNAKVIIRYANNNAKFFLNGVEIASDTSVTTPTGLDRIVLNNGTGGSPFYGFNKQLIYFNSALTDDQCIALTK